MSYLNINEELFLEKQELNRLVQFLDEWGWRLPFQKDIYEDGIVKAGDDLNFTNFKIEQGTNQKTVKLAVDSYAINASGNIIVRRAEDNIPIPDDNRWYWIKIKHRYTPKEVGIVNVDQYGNLTGSGTNFLEVLRGQPNFPARIKFYGTGLNPLDYDVVEVIDDTNAVLSGTFQAEANLTYSVVGTFTPGHVPSASAREIFRYDSCIDFTVEGGGLVAESLLNVAPTKAVGQDYYIARVKVVGINVIVEDKRTEIYRTRAEYLSHYIDKSINTLIGVEAVRWDHPKSPRYRNEITVGWGLRSTSYTLSGSRREVTINNGQGGKFKESAIINNFTNGMFNGWRLYANNGSYQKVINSVLDGSAIKITLDCLNLDDYAVGEYIYIVPDIDEISIKAVSNVGLQPLLDTEVTFPIKEGYGNFFVTVPVQTGSYMYNLQYRYKKCGEFSQWFVFSNDNNPLDANAGFYTESSHYDDGLLKPLIDRTRKKYSAGFVELIPATNAYLSTIQSFITGDLFGIHVRQLPSGNLLNLQVGVDKQVQLFTGIVGNTLTSNYVIHLKSTGAINGNKFRLIFAGKIIPDLFYLSINKDYVDPANPGTKLKLFKDTEHDYMVWPGKQVIVECYYDGSTWHAQTVETDEWRLGDIKMATNVTLNSTNFTTNGYGKSNEYLGWALCNGSTYASTLFGNWITPNLKNKFIRGWEPGVTNIGDTGGQNTVTQVINHSHPYSTTADANGSHSHTVSVKTITVNDGNGEKVTNNPNDSDNEGWEDYTAAAAGSHTHTVSGTTSNPTGGVSYIDNRPEFYTLAFLQRVPYAAISGVPVTANDIQPTI